MSELESHCDCERDNLSLHAKRTMIWVLLKHLMYEETPSRKATQGSQGRLRAGEAKQQGSAEGALARKRPWWHQL